MANPSRRYTLDCQSSSFHHPNLTGYHYSSITFNTSETGFRGYKLYSPIISSTFLMIFIVITVVFQSSGGLHTEAGFLSTQIPFTGPEHSHLFLCWHLLTPEQPKEASDKLSHHLSVFPEKEPSLKTSHNQFALSQSLGCEENIEPVRHITEKKGSIWKLWIT